MAAGQISYQHLLKAFHLGTCILSLPSTLSFLSFPLTTYKTMSPHCHLTQDGISTNLNPSNMRITAYGGNVVTHYGTCKLQVTHRNESVMSTFHVVKSNGSTIIGLPTCLALKLVTLNYAMNIGPTGELDIYTTAAVPTYTTRSKGDETAKASILNKYADLFDGIGCFEGEYHITLDSTVPPVVNSPRRVPVVLREPLKRNWTLSANKAP